MSSSTSYSTDYFPPAPLLQVTILAAGEGGRDQEVSALVDTAADGTILPRALLQAAGAPFVERRFLREMTGSRVAVELYRVRRRIGPPTIYGIHAVALSETEPLLGRDALAPLRLLLDGPAETVELLK